jgi:hypothetical protein
MENDGPVVGPDAPTAKGCFEDSATRGEWKGSSSEAGSRRQELLFRKRKNTAPTAKDRFASKAGIKTIDGKADAKRQYHYGLAEIPGRRMECKRKVVACTASNRTHTP